MTFASGKSGNPQGRPAGIADKRTAMREMLEPYAPALVEKVVKLAFQGDTTALRICLERLIPALRSVELYSTTHIDIRAALADARAQIAIINQIDET